MIPILFTALLGTIQSCTAADIRIWAFEATVINLDDPQALFGDVRLGDSVVGDFAYDLDVASSQSTETWADYVHSPGFYGIRLSIINARTDEQMVYEPQLQYGYQVSVFTDHYLFPGDSAVDFWQDVTPPLPGLRDLVYLDISGPAVLSETSLLTEFDLEAWQNAAFYLGADSYFNGVTAQIHTITSVSPGDYDRNGVVDLEDLLRWQIEYGLQGLSDTDGNRNGLVDGADFLIWQRSVGGHPAAVNIVPESEWLCFVALFVPGVFALCNRPNRPRILEVSR